MKEYNYKKIDAFTDGNSSGNPAGFVLLEKDEFLSEDTMQAIARSEKGIVSEVAFCTPLREDLFSLKYYSSECEVEFCGHATIACMYHLIKNTPNLVNKDQITIKTVMGDLPVFNDIRHSDSVFITAPEAKHLDTFPGSAQIADFLGIAPETFHKKLNVSFINAGLRTLIVPIASLEAAVKITPDQARLAEFCRLSEVDIILVFSPEVALKDNQFHTRVFAPKFGYLEDPATGSGNAAFGYYLLGESLWNGELISIEQGPDINQPNIVKLKAMAIDGKKRVSFGGNGTVQYEKQLII